MNSVYILKLSDNSYYVGSTKNLEKRFKEHCNGRVMSTKSKLPASIIYKEEFEVYVDARRREFQIKSWKSRKAIEKLIATI